MNMHSVLFEYHQSIGRKRLDFSSDIYTVDQSNHSNFEFYREFIDSKIQDADSDELSQVGCNLVCHASDQSSGITFQSDGEGKWAIRYHRFIGLNGSDVKNGGEYYPLCTDIDSREFVWLPYDWCVPSSAVISYDTLLGCIQDFLESPFDFPKSIMNWQEVDDFEWPEELY